MKKHFLIACVLLKLSAQAQVENRATLTYGYFAPSNNNAIQNFNQSNLEFGYNLNSKMIAKKVKWDNSFGYKLAYFDGGITTDFQDISYASSFVYTKNRKNFIIGNARINYRSQLIEAEKLNGNAFFPAVSVGYMRQSQTNKAIRWAAGINYNNDFGKNVVLPFFIFNYETAKLKFNATLPTSILLLIRENPKFYYGLNAILASSIFYTKLPDNQKIQILNANMFAFAQIKLKDKLWLEAKPGFTIRRDYNTLDTDFKVEPIKGSQRFDPNFVFLTGLLYKMN